MYSIATIKQNLKRYKDVIAKTRVKGVSQKFFFEGLYPLVNKTTKENNKKKASANKGLPFDVIQEIRRVDLLLQKNDFEVLRNQTAEQVRSYHLIYILALTTGRRFTELVKTVTISRKKDKFYFKGLLKKDNRLDTKSYQAHFIELSFTKVSLYLRELRKYVEGKLKRDKNLSLKDISVSQVNTIFHQTYNNGVKRISGGKVSNVHEFRHFFVIYHQDNYIAQNPIIQDLDNEALESVLMNVRKTVLAHEMGLDSSSSYVIIK
jgi:hypothetical protein